MTCPHCGGTKEIGTSRSFDPATSKPGKKQPIPCPTCTTIPKET